MTTFDTIHAAVAAVAQNRKALLAQLVALACDHAVDHDYGSLTLPLAAADQAAAILRANGVAVAQSDNGWTAIEIMPLWFHRTPKAHVFWSGTISANGAFTIRYSRLVDPREIADFVRPGYYHGWSVKTRKTEAGLVITWHNTNREYAFEVAERHRRAA
jgi:hypothetical protein